MDVSRSGAWHTMPCIDESIGSKRVVNPVTADVVLLTVACLVKIPELIESKAAPESVPMDADASVARPVTPKVPEHEAFASEVRPVTPSVPEHEAFTRDVRPVTLRVPEHDAFAREVIPATPSVPEHEAFGSVESPVTAIVELNVEEPETRVPIVADVAFRDVAVVAWRDAVDPVATTKLLTTVVVVGETVKRG